MDIWVIIGLVVSFGGILAGYMLDEGVISKLLNPIPMLIVFGGTFGAVITSFPVSELKKLIPALKLVITTKQYNEVDIINQLAEMSEKARKDGLLSLEQDAQNNENELVKKGLALVVDGIETEVIKDILIRETQLRESIYESSAKILETAGGFGPTMGVLGTVMGMVSILGSMEEDPGGLGGKIATAFLATMFGVGSANVLYIPLANRIKAKAERETMINDLIIEGLLSIQAGENPRIIKEKLNLTLLEKMSGKKPSGKAAEGAEAEG